MEIIYAFRIDKKMVTNRSESFVQVDKYSITPRWSVDFILYLFHQVQNSLSEFFSLDDSHIFNF